MLEVNLFYLNFHLLHEFCILNKILMNRTLLKFCVEITKWHVYIINVVEVKDCMYIYLYIRSFKTKKKKKRERKRNIREFSSSSLSSLSSFKCVSLFYYEWCMSVWECKSVWRSTNFQHAILIIVQNLSRNFDPELYGFLFQLPTTENLASYYMMNPKSNLRYSSISIRVWIGFLYIGD